MLFDLFRDQRFKVLGVTDSVILGPNPRRKAILLSCPPPSATPFTSDGQIAHAVSTAAAGVVQSYTVPAGAQAYLDSATYFVVVAGAVTVALQLVRGGVTVSLTQFSANGIWTGAVPLQAGDVVQWNVTTPVAATTADFTINIRRESVPSKVTISWGQPAVIDQGLALYAGGAPVLVTSEYAGRAFPEDVHAIASIGTPTIGVTDLFTGWEVLQAAGSVVK